MHQKKISAGVPEGSAVSATFFNIYLHYILSLVNCSHANFADDTAIYCSDEDSQKIINNLELNYKQISEYFNIWKIKLNVDKP